MKIAPEFIRDVQRAGWRIEHVAADSVTGRCPRDGCAVRATLKPNAVLPQVCPDADGRLPMPYRPTEVAMRKYDDARVALRLRRQSLGLSIAEVEECAGVVEHHLAKAEKRNPSRTPIMPIFSEWCEALGFGLYVAEADDTTRRAQVDLQGGTARTVDTVVGFLAGLGLVLVMREQDLPSKTIGVIATSREHVESRMRGSQLARRLGAERLQSLKRGR